MNDIYKLHQEGKVFTWELIEVTGPKPEPRSSFGCTLATDNSFYLFGGSGDNNLKYNDLWEFNTNAWHCILKGTPFSSEAAESGCPDGSPLQKSGVQIALYKNRHILVFGGIHEVTYEMNDLKTFDLTTKKWHTIDEENKNNSESGSPKNKQLIQQNESTKKNMFTLKNPNLNLDSSI